MQTSTTQRNLFCIILLLFVWSCDDDNGKKSSAERKLPEFLKFTGQAEGTEDDINVDCLCDLNLELPEFEVTGETQVFSGSLGGEIIRAVTDDDGAGFSFAPFLYGEITLTVKPNDSVYLEWPGNLNTGIPFYNEIALFKGKVTDEGTVNGTWYCAPLNMNEGGYVDMKGTVEGTWTLEEFE